MMAGGRAWSWLMCERMVISLKGWYSRQMVPVWRLEFFFFFLPSYPLHLVLLYNKVLSYNRVLMFIHKVNKHQHLEMQEGSWHQGDLVEDREGTHPIDRVSQIWGFHFTGMVLGTPG